MTEIYSFIFSLGLGIVARLLYLGASALAKRTDFLPVTIILDVLTAAIVGGAFTAYIILSAAELAPYMFAALGGGYFITLALTRKRRNNNSA